MPFQQVLRDLLTDDLFIGYQHIKVVLTLLRSDLEGHMQQLADMRVKVGVDLHVSQGCRHLWAVPSSYIFRRGQLRFVDIDHTGIRSTKLVDVFQRVFVDFFGQGQTISASFRQSNQFFQPGCAGGFHMHACSGTPKCLTNGRIDAEFVTAAVDTQLQVFRQAVTFDGFRNHGNVGVEFGSELLDVANVVDPFVESPCKLGRDRLKLDVLIGQRGQNNK